MRLFIYIVTALSLNGQIARPTVNPFSGGNHPFMQQGTGGTMLPFGRPMGMPFGFGNNNMFPSRPSGRPQPNPQPPNNNGTNSITKPIQINNGYAKGVAVPFSFRAATNGNATTSTNAPVSSGQAAMVRLNLRNRTQMMQQHQLYKQWRIALRKTRGNNNGKNNNTQPQKQN